MILDTDIKVSVVEYLGKSIYKVNCIMAMVANKDLKMKNQFYICVE